MAEGLTAHEKVIYVVGQIVLCCQEIETHIKFLLPFTDSEDASLSAIQARRGKLENRPLGVVAEQFVAALTGDIEAVREQVHRVVKKRNGLVHQYMQTYGERIRAGQYQDILSTLRLQHEEALGLLGMLREMTLHLAEAMRDTTFVGTDEHAELVALCTQARAQMIGNSDI